MKTVEDITDKDYDQIAKDIISLSKKKDNELYQILGHASYDMGVKASDKQNILLERVDMGTNGISALKAFNHVAKTKPLDNKTAEKSGKKFWKVFGKKIKKAICENQSIIDIINGEADLKTKLAVAIPAILALIGGGIVLGPVYLTVISVAFAIIIKSGLAAYCEV